MIWFVVKEKINDPVFNAILEEQEEKDKSDE